MSTTYKTVVGDTFDLISRKVYGTEKEAGRIAKANPNAFEPLPIGIDLFIPLLQPQIVGTVPANSPDEVALLIDGSRFRFWSSMKIRRSIDKFSTIDLTAPFDKKNRAIFRPLSFRDLSVIVGGDLLFTGTMLNVLPVIAPDNKSFSVNGYSRPGVLNDCTPPVSALPLEFDGHGLQHIAEALVAPFGIQVQAIDNQGAIFQRVAATPTKKILAFLITLATQRNFVISDNAAGDIVFWQSVTDSQPVAKLVQGQSPLISVTPSFNPQSYFSHITGMGPTIIGVGGPKYTVKNKHLTNALRPLCFSATDSMDSDIKQSTKAKAGRMFGSMVEYAVNVSTWRDSNGDLWAPNTIVNVTAPDALIYNPYNLLIKDVDLSRDDKSESAVLTLVIPESYRGELPEVLPWDE